MGQLTDLFTKYYGVTGAAAAGRIDFQFVDCWAANGDYFGAIRTAINCLRPDVCVTCLDRPSSFLEIALYSLSPLLQVEIINRSAFVRHCDILIPNGATPVEHRGPFNYFNAPLPQIPFPLTEKVTKVSLGFTDNCYLLGVIGKDFTRRMEGEGKTELSLGFARALAGLMAAEPSLSILLVGENPTHLNDWFEAAGITGLGGSRMRVVEFATDLRATILACDLIVNPPIKGGGRGMALAISDQLPVLIFPDADAANFVKQTNIMRDLTDFVLNVWRYLRRGVGWREHYVGASGLTPFSNEYNHSSAASFVEASRTAAAHGRSRLRRGAPGQISYNKIQQPVGFRDAN